MAHDPGKTARRVELRARRRAVAGARDLDTDGALLAGHVVGLLDELHLPPGSVVTSYVAVPGEPPTAPLNAALVARGIRVLVPITLPGLDLDWHDVTDVGETPQGREAVGLADLVLAPGLAVDRQGTRMGQGGGCYDRALPRRRPGTPVVVMLHPGELVDAAEPLLPRQSHDHPVDAVVTADGVTDLGLSPWRRRPPGAG